MSPRVYVRKFDHEEARARYASGESISALAREYGVYENAVRRVAKPGEAERQAAVKRAWEATGRCDDCGGPMNRMSRSLGSTRCVKCASLARATSVQDTELRCFICREWKPDREFPFNRGGRKARRGRHHYCRDCQTVVRREYRQRNREKSNAYDREYKRRRRKVAA